MAKPWPLEPVPPDGRPAWQILNEIVFRAHGAAPVNIDLIVWLAFKCAANDHAHHPHPFPLNDLHVINALNAAKIGQWGVVERELDHD